MHDDAAIAVNTPDLNFTGHPAVSVPLGRDAAGVPFGLQIVAPRFLGRPGPGVGRTCWNGSGPGRWWPPGYIPFWAG